MSEAVAIIALEVHPDRVAAICSALISSQSHDVASVVRSNVGAGFSSQLIRQFDTAIVKYPNVSCADLALMFQAASMTAVLAARISSSELVWTGPATGLVPVRHTVQVLAGLIDQAVHELFFVSFVAYDVPSIISALQRAVLRGVKLSVLVEQSKEHGGNLTVDSLGKLRRKIPEAKFYVWDRTALSDSAQSASVHAKCAVADSSVAFITSANLSDAAMERNMELGVLINRGPLPEQLHRHLDALVATRYIVESL
ncbi:MAG: DISARM system phospholipase D-like protein DrmC [Verrucomicrobia bacterium]|nr:DISARM system phospholipase D-like protein DrmC [Verrucomicrobiota bacterium]